MSVKETIAGALGQIGRPDALIPMCVDNLMKSYQNCSGSEESALKSMLVWSIGRLASRQTGQKVQKLLIQALQDPYWKVRAAACIAIASFGD